MAWEFGLLSGVAKSGVDLGYIDLTVGTSAGSAVGAWFRSGSVTDADVVSRLEALGGELLGLITELTAVASQTSGSRTALPKR
jgi:NTE family protein